MKARHIPNIISVIRIILVIPVVVCLLQGNYHWALLLFLIAGLSDGLDGYLARRFGWSSHLGGILDPMGDKLLMVFSYLVLGWLQYLPLWLVVAVILRDVIIVSGGLLYRILIGKVVAEPLLISKINTVLQILLVLLVLISLAIWQVPAQIIEILTYVVFITTVMSGVSYVVLWGQRAWQAHRMRMTHE